MSEPVQTLKHFNFMSDVLAFIPTERFKPSTIFVLFGDVEVITYKATVLNNTEGVWAGCRDYAIGLQLGEELKKDNQLYTKLKEALSQNKEWPNHYSDGDYLYVNIGKLFAMPEFPLISELLASGKITVVSNDNNNTSTEVDTTNLFSMV